MVVAFISATHSAESLKALQRILSPQISIALWSQGEYCGAGIPQLLLTNVVMNRVDCPHTIHIALNGSDGIPQLGADTILLVSSSMCESVHHAGQVISIGMRQKDTISVASREEQHVLVSLMRPIQNVWGDEVDPQEISLEVPFQAEIHEILAAAALLLLL